MKRFILVLLGLFFSFLFLEIGLQTAGILLKTVRKYRVYYATNTYGSIKNKDVITVMCIGESTTEGQYPLLLKEYLSAYMPDKKFNIIDSGYGGIKLDDLYFKVQTNIEKYNPDIIVGMIGINDTTEYIFKIISSKLKTLRFLKLIYSSYKKQYIIKKIKDDYDFGKLTPEKANRIKAELYASIFIGNIESKSSLLFLLAQTTKHEAVHIYGMKNELFASLLSKYYDNYSNNRDITFDKLTDVLINDNNINKDFRYGLKGILCMTKSDYEQGLKNLDKADSIRLTYNYTEISKKHKKILDLIIKKNIQYVAMQYPVRDIGNLKKIIENTGYGNKVVFVENKNNFRKALMSKKNHEIFADLFAWDFGHCKNYGNRLIADNLAKELSNILK
ncbi:MAG: hypothetical protein PHR82_02185 [Endomicrobiaceae bacterium]|nr:hypothetical protein [Endomicrobiaceae bacterium]